MKKIDIEGKTHVVMTEEEYRESRAFMRDVISRLNDIFNESADTHWEAERRSYLIEEKGIQALRDHTGVINHLSISTIEDIERFMRTKYILRSR